MSKPLKYLMLLEDQDKFQRHHTRSSFETRVTCLGSICPQLQSLSVTYAEPPLVLRVSTQD